MDADPGMLIPQRHWTPSYVPPVVPLFSNDNFMPAAVRVNKRKAQEHGNIQVNAIERQHPELRVLGRKQKAIEAVDEYFRGAAVNEDTEQLDSVSVGAAATLQYGRQYDSTFHNSVLGHLQGWHSATSSRYRDASKVMDAATQTDAFTAGSALVASKAAPIRRTRSAQKQLSKI